MKGLGFEPRDREREKARGELIFQFYSKGVRAERQSNHNSKAMVQAQILQLEHESLGEEEQSNSTIGRGTTTSYHSYSFRERIHTTGTFQDLPKREPNTWFIDSKLSK